MRFGAGWVAGGQLHDGSISQISRIARIARIAGGGGGGDMKYHHGGIQSPISTQSTPPPQLAPPPPQFGPQCPCPCPGPGIPGILGQCGLASATPAPSPRAVKPTTPDVAATTTIFLRFILHPWCTCLPQRCSSWSTRITSASSPAARRSRAHGERVDHSAVADDPAQLVSLTQSRRHHHLDGTDPHTDTTTCLNTAPPSRRVIAG